MIVDSSALLAILSRETDATRYEEAILTAATCSMSVANVPDASIVVESKGGARAGHELNAFLDAAGIRTASANSEHLEAARQAWKRFGRGRHPAALKFGDCFSYALARVTDEPLLYKGNGLAQAGILSAMPPTHRPAGTSS